MEDAFLMVMDEGAGLEVQRHLSRYFLREDRQAIAHGTVVPPTPHPESLDLTTASRGLAQAPRRKEQARSLSDRHNPADNDTSRSILGGLHTTTARC